MIDYQLRFNPDASVPHARIKKHLSVIRQFSTDGKQETTNREFDSSQIELGMKITEKIEEAKEALLDELLVIFYSLSNDEKENLDVEQRQTMINQVESVRPALFSFLGLSGAVRSLPDASL